MDSREYHGRLSSRIRKLQAEITHHQKEVAYYDLKLRRLDTYLSQKVLPDWIYFPARDKFYRYVKAFEYHEDALKSKENIVNKLFEQRRKFRWKTRNVWPPSKFNKR